jgi:hypothetical protein
MLLLLVAVDYLSNKDTVEEMGVMDHYYFLNLIEDHEYNVELYK